MLRWQDLTVTEDECDRIVCDCCGTYTLTAFGSIEGPDGYLGWYTASFTEGHPDRGASFGVFVGDWSADAPETARWAVALDFFPGPEGGFRVAEDQSARLATTRAVKLSRDQIVGTPFADDMFAMLDAAFVNDSRLAGLRGWGAD